MIDKFEFGKAPAAIYLAEHLRVLNDNGLHRKIAKTISEFRALVRSLENAHNCEFLPTKHLNMMCPMLRLKCDGIFDTFLKMDVLAANLVGNILRGEIKRLIRKGSVVKKMENKKTSIIAHLKNDIAKEIDEVTKQELNELIDDVYYHEIIVEDNITAETLQLKSKAKLKRLNKKDTLY